MGVISLENTDRLYWLGRYTERVYTTIRLFEESFDKMIDQSEESYSLFCSDLDIPNIYHSAEDFIDRYCFDENDINSIYSNLQRAYDNAIMLREEIGSESLAYIQLAVYAMNRAKGNQAPLIELQKVMDNIMAFWGITDDMILDENVRNIIKIGKRVERIDLYARLRQPAKDMDREVRRLAGRIDRTNIKYKKDMLEKLMELVQCEEIPYLIVVAVVESLLEE